MDNQQGLYNTENSPQCYVAAWMRERVGLEGEWLHVYVWLSPFSVHLKLSQHLNWLYINTKYKVKKNHCSFPFATS